MTCSARKLNYGEIIPAPMAMRIEFAAQIRKQIWSCRFFSCSVRVSFYALNIRSFCQTNRLFILLERAEKEICFSMANGMFKTQIDMDRHGPRLIPNNCKNLYPPYFSLPTTFNCTISQFRSSNPWIQILIYLKCWIRTLIYLKCRSGSAMSYMRIDTHCFTDTLIN